MQIPRFLGLGLICAACSTQEARHLPANPLLLPVYGASAAVHNATYNARRGQVEAFVNEHHDQLISEITQTPGPGPALARAYTLARVPKAAQAPLTKRLAEDTRLYRTSPEALVVALMVHGDN